MHCRGVPSIQPVGPAVQALRKKGRGTPAADKGRAVSWVGVWEGEVPAGNSSDVSLDGRCSRSASRLVGGRVANQAPHHMLSISNACASPPLIPALPSLTPLPSCPAAAVPAAAVTTTLLSCCSRLLE